MQIKGEFNTVPNAHTVFLGDIALYFSYDTPIGVEEYREGTVRRQIVRKNEWGPTTGKHLNRIDGGSEEAKARRVSSEEFTERLNELLSTLK